jgi:membrane associated rhomboid family serine protease
VTPWVLRLLVANVVVFGIQELNMMPGVVQWMVLFPQDVITTPWTLVTYAFLHGSFSHILFNMLGLFIFGPRVESHIGGRRFLTMYLAAAVVGGLLSVMLSKSPIIGASAAIMGVSFAFAWFWPRTIIYLFGAVPVEAWLMVLLYGLYDLWSGAGGRATGIAHFAHLGGYLGAWLYLWGLDHWSPSKAFKRKVETVPKQTEKQLKANLDKVNLEGVHELSREEVNRILDKISAQGMGSLTAQEKLFLSNFVPPDDRKSWTQ